MDRRISKNETVRLLTKGLKVPHHFTLPYTPWSNGSIERLGKELLRVFRSVISELRMRFEEWPDLVPLVQSAINNAPSPQRGGVAPITVFTCNDSLHAYRDISPNGNYKAFVAGRRTTRTISEHSIAAKARRITPIVLCNTNCKTIARQLQVRPGSCIKRYSTTIHRRRFCYRRSRRLFRW